MPPPFQRQPYDRTYHRSRMVNLMTGQGQIAASGELRQGQIASRTAENVAGIASGMAEDLWGEEAQLRRREQAERRSQLDEQGRRRSKATNLDQLMTMIGQMPPDDAADVLDKEGYRDEAHTLRTQTLALRQQLVQEQIQQWTLTRHNMEEASKLIDSVTQLEQPEAQSAQYAAVLPKVRALIGEETVAQLGLKDTYDPNTAAGFAQYTMTAAQRFALREKTWHEAQAAMRTKEERMRQGLPFLAQLQDDVDGQEEWAYNNELARGMGVPAEAIAAVGEQYSPEAQERLRRFLPKSARDDEKFDFDAFMRAEPKVREQMLRARAQWEAAGRKPDTPKPGEPPSVTEHDLDTFRAEVEASYRRQVAAVNDEPASQAQVAAAERWRSAELRRIAELRQEIRRKGRGAAPTPSTGRPEQFQVPAEVQKSLTRGPGDYKFQDGSVWRLQRDGRVVRVK